MVDTASGLNGLHAVRLVETVHRYDIGSVLTPLKQDDGQSCDVLGPDLQTQQCKMSECKGGKVT